MPIDIGIQYPLMPIDISINGFPTWFGEFFNFVLIFHLTQYNFTNFFTLRKLKQQSVNSVISRFFKFLKSLVEIPWIDNNVINAVITRTQWIEHHSWPSIKLIEIPHGFAIREFQSFIEGHLWCSISVEYLWWPC